MKDQIKELLDKAIVNRLEEVQHSDEESEHDKNALKEAKELVAMKVELEKLDEQDVKIAEAKKDRWVQIGTCAAGIIVTPIIAFVIDRAHMKTLCNFEKDYTFTTSFGRGLASKLSRFKK